MSRAARLLQLLEILRKRRSVVTGAELAEATGVSLRTLYRDIEELRAQGVTIQGEAGTGYRVIPGWVLPPLMFDEDELEALFLGIRWVSRRTDPALERSARSALHKIEAVLPVDLRHVFENSALLVGPSFHPQPPVPASVGLEAKFEAWNTAGASVVQELSSKDFGDTFTMVDPDGHRLRAMVPQAG